MTYLPAESTGSSASRTQAQIVVPSAESLCASAQFRVSPLIEQRCQFAETTIVGKEIVLKRRLGQGFQLEEIGSIAGCKTRAKPQCPVYFDSSAAVPPILYSE